MKIGVRVHDFGKSDAKTLAKKAKEVGFDGVQLVLNKAIEGESGLAGTLSKEKANSIYEAFKSEGLDDVFQKQREYKSSGRTIPGLEDIF